VANRRIGHQSVEFGRFDEADGPDLALKTQDARAFVSIWVMSAMQPRHQVSSAAIELIKRFEGFRRSAAELPDGRWTIGFGHTRSAREGARITEEDASALLLFDLAEVCVVLNEVIFTPLTQNQFDALVSFAMNIGIDNFRSSTALLRINEGSLLQAAGAIEMWRKADFEGERIVVDALVRRRAAEKALFLTPTDGFVPTPSPVVRPQMDYAAAASPAAVELIAPLDGDDAVAIREPDEAPRPSPTEVAAASVSARLQAILSDLDLQPQDEPDPSAEAAPLAQLAEVEPFERAEPEAPRETEAAVAATTFFDPALGARRRMADERYEPFADSARQTDHPEDWAARRSSAQDSEEGRDLFDQDRFHASQDADAASRTYKAGRTRSRYLPLTLMLVVGLSLLAGATFWFVAAHPKVGGLAPSVIGWALGLTGIALLASSIYFLLERIGARDDEG